VINTLTRSRGVLLPSCLVLLRFGIRFLKSGTETLTHARPAEQGSLVMRHSHRVYSTSI